MNQQRFPKKHLLYFGIGMLVAVGAYAALKNNNDDIATDSGSEKVVKDEKIVPLSDEATADFRVYKNKKFGYEFKYPFPGSIFSSTGYFAPKTEEKMPIDSRILVYFRVNGSDTDVVEFYVLPNDKKLSPEKYAESIIRKPCFVEESQLQLGPIQTYQLWISNYFGSFDDAPEVNTKSDSICGGKPAVEVPKSRVIFVPLRDESKILRISYLYDFGKEEKRSGETEEIVRKVLATFKITN